MTGSTASIKDRHLGTLLAGIFIGVFLVLGWKVVQQQKTWEECVVDRMDAAHTTAATHVLARFCQSKYPSPTSTKQQ